MLNFTVEPRRQMANLLQAALEVRMEDKTELFNEEAVVRLLREEIKRAGSQLALARQLEIGRPYLNKVVNKRLLPRRSTIAKLGLELVYKGDVLLDHKSLLRRLRTEIKSAGGQAAWSRETGIDRTVINQVANKFSSTVKRN